MWIPAEFFPFVLLFAGFLLIFVFGVVFDLLRVEIFRRFVGLEASFWDKTTWLPTLRDLFFVPDFEGAAISSSARYRKSPSLRQSETLWMKRTIFWNDRYSQSAWKIAAPFSIWKCVKGISFWGPWESTEIKNWRVEDYSFPCKYAYNGQKDLQWFLVLVRPLRNERSHWVR